MLAPQLTVSDRCDMCGAQAYTAWVKGKSELTFCAHHTRDHELALIAGDWSIDADDRELLTEAVREPEPA